jgi:hypothetical protein
MARTPFELKEPLALQRLTPGNGATLVATNIRVVAAN